MTSNFLYLSFSTLHDTTIVAKFYNPPSQISPRLNYAPPPPPSNLSEISKPAQGVNGGFTVFVKEDVLTNS